MTRTGLLKEFPSLCRLAVAAVTLVRRQQSNDCLLLDAMLRQLCDKHYENLTLTDLEAPQDVRQVTGTKRKGTFDKNRQEGHSSSALWCSSV